MRPIFFLLALCFVSSFAVAGDALENGRRIFLESCASCHGERGEGTDDVSSPLFGDRSEFDLTEVIATTMPEGEPETVVGDEARDVAKWMIAEFYSPQAQARINPPRQKLSRLTVAQYRNAVADLVTGFRWTVEPGKEQGLKGQYFHGRHHRDRNKVVERIDTSFSFDFGEGVPEGGDFKKPEEFSIRWEGAIAIDETGWYDFVVNTENAVRLYVNDHEEPLINAYVKSGDGTEYRASRFLLSGRVYPIRIDWFKFKEKTASVEFLWKPPHGEDQPIPIRHLSTEWAPEILVVETPFPPDDRSDGYIRGTSVSPEWDEATTFAAVEVADRITPMLRELAKIGKKDDDATKREKLQQFCQTFAYRAFRRPLDDEQKRAYVDSNFESDVSVEDSVRRSLLAVLKSPRFLYREISPTKDLYTRMERLAFAIHDSIPDPQLLEGAKEGWFESEEAIRQQATRLLKTYRGQVRLQEFLRVWLALDRLHETDKDPELFTDFNEDVLSSMRTSLEEFLHDVATRETTDFEYLLNANTVPMNGELTQFFRLEEADSDPHTFKPVQFETEHRAGVVSHPYLLTSLAYRDVTSPIHRGVFLSRGILGRSLKPPADSVTPTPPDLDPHLTTRERVAEQTSPAMCANCHKMINGLGFSLERFDAVGRLRDKEKNKPIDDSGNYRIHSGEMKKFAGAVELARFLHQSSETHRSFSRQLFHHMVQQPILSYGADTIDKLTQQFQSSELNMKQLMIEVAILSCLHDN